MEEHELSYMLGRNDPCWCGSGKKYKKCHLGREDDEAMSPWEAVQAQRGAFSARNCMASEIWNGTCSGKIVSAHTVPRSGSLARIARDGHVYTFMNGLESLIQNHGRLVPQLKGINKASTFYGFCRKHDNDLFSPLEKADFVGSEQQCFLLAYRAVAKEIYNKRAQSQLIHTYRQADRGQPKEVQQFIQSFVDSFELGVQAAIRDLEYNMDSFKKALVNDDFAKVKAYVIEFDQPPTVMGSGGFNPEYDFAGRALQDLTDLSKSTRLLTVSSFYGGHTGFVVLAWTKDGDDVCRAFANSLATIPDTDLTEAIVALMFEHLENIQVQPTWWESLSGVQKTALLERMQSGADPISARAQNCLQWPSLGLPRWGVRSRRWVG